MSEKSYDRIAPLIKRALSLSGGSGSRGAYQVGIWRRPQEIGRRPDIVCGTSIGAINGAVIGSADSLLQELALHLGVDLRTRRELLTSQHFVDLGDIRIGVVAPKTACGMDSLLDLDPQHIREPVAAGYDDATDQLAGFLQQPRDS